MAMSDTNPPMTAADVDYETLRNKPIGEVRKVIRAGAYRGHTAGFGAGLLQANLAILRYADAVDFHQFCQRNPRPCPLVGVSAPGNPHIPELGRDIDIRTDVPAYNVYRDGQLADEVSDISSLWQDDFVVFALGCSFTFERALLDAGIRLEHIEKNRTVSMYKTNIALEQAGPFGGGTVVSMRPIERSKVEKVYEVCGNYVHAHGEPVHWGDPAEIGIADLETPDWGDTTEMREDEVPVFWACGVTPQNVLADARPSICITHKPGSMLVTDHPEDVPPVVADLIPPAVSAAE